jgi:hypothetical protein
MGLFWGTMLEFCSAQPGCLVMNGGPGFDYYWMDSQKKSVKLPAAQYIDYVLSWVQSIVSDESQFPTRAGCSFLGRGTIS